MNSPDLNEQLISIISNNVHDIKLEKIKNLIAQGADINCVNNNGFPLLHINIGALNTFFINQTRLDVQDLLIDSGVDINGFDLSGQNILLYAMHTISLNGVGNDAKPFIRSMLEAGADSNSETKTGSTPLHLMCDKNWHEFIIPLLDNSFKENPSFDIGKKSRFRKSAEEYAMKQGHDECIDALNSYDVNLRLNKENATAPIITPSRRF